MQSNQNFNSSSKLKVFKVISTSKYLHKCDLLKTLFHIFSLLLLKHKLHCILTLEMSTNRVVAVAILFAKTKKSNPKQSLTIYHKCEEP